MNMKNALALTLVTFGLSLTALAAPKPWLAMVGKYSVPETCSLESQDGFNKAQISILKNAWGIELKYFKGANAVSQHIAITDFSTRATGSDGNVFFAVKNITDNSFVSTEHFVRKGSDTWPDLEMLNTYSLTLVNGELTLVRTHQNTRSRNVPSTTTCVLTSLENDTNEILVDDISKFADKDLARLAKAADFANAVGMDLDQAAFQIGKFEMSSVQVSKDQLLEILALHANLANAEIEIFSVGSKKPEVIAQNSLITALNIPSAADLNTPDYAPLRALKSAMIDLLKLNKANLKVLLVKWNESDSDGQGLLLIDQTTGQALYVGSGYFS
jgi:hypothetical protein